MSDVAQQALDSASHMRNAARVKRDEEELKQLMEQHNGTAQDEEEDAEQEDRVVKTTEVEQSDAEPDSKPLSKEEESLRNATVICVGICKTKSRSGSNALIS